MQLRESTSFNVMPGNRHETFLRAFTTHEPAVRAFVRRLVPTRSDADDILQEVAIVLWEKFDDFQVGADFKAWAFGIARFKVLARLRDINRNRLVLANDVVEMVAMVSEQEESQLQQQRDALETCFEKLPGNDRTLIIKAYQNDVKFQEIAKFSGRSVSGFYQWLRRMRQLLLSCIQQEIARRAAL